MGNGGQFPHLSRKALNILLPLATSYPSYLSQHVSLQNKIYFYDEPGNRTKSGHFKTGTSV
jgi:hypothetical protein